MLNVTNVEGNSPAEVVDQINELSEGKGFRLSGTDYYQYINVSDDPTHVETVVFGCYVSYVGTITPPEV